jgi:hypothetical protein
LLLFLRFFSPTKAKPAENATASLNVGLFSQLEIQIRKNEGEVASSLSHGGSLFDSWVVGFYQGETLNVRFPELLS